MMDIFKCIAELDLGPQASASFTIDAMNDMVREVLAAAEFCVVLKSEIVEGRENSSLWERVDTRQDLSSRELMTLEKLAQKGNRLAVVLIDVEEVLRIIESKGYVRCVETSFGSESFIAGWAAWLELHFSDVKGALVFGHDWEPIYIFKNLKG